MAERTNGQIIFSTLIAVVIGAFIGWAGGDGGDQYQGVAVFAICAALAFAINWLVFIPSAMAQSDKFYDLTGGITYLTVTAVAVVLSSELDLRGQIAGGMVVAWAVRLSTFLFRRISKAGHDGRFDVIKTRPARFLLAWTLQGLWVLLTAATALAIITGGTRVPLGLIGYVGIAVWAIGWGIEVAADNQKAAFNSDPANKGKFINVGLWRWSRHPNYFGEIMLWVGMAIIALPVLQGWQWATLISPVFVYFLLTKVSGVPMLEDRADQRWGGQEDYEEYKQKTPVLFLKPPSN